MTKLKILYKSEEEKENLIATLKKDYQVLKISKEYSGAGKFKRIHIELK